MKNKIKYQDISQKYTCYNTNDSPFEIKNDLISTQKKYYICRRANPKHNKQITTCILLKNLFPHK